MRQRSAVARATRRELLALACTTLMLAQPASPTAARVAGAQAGRAPPIIILPVCDGDCDGDGQVSIDELVTGVNIALGQRDTGACPAFDADADGTVTIAELVAAVSGALAGCGAEQEPLSLSAAALAPGEMLTVFHASIAAGDAVVITFRGAGRYRLTVRTELTESGAAQVAVPPFIDTSSGRFTAGEVAVSIAGVDSEATLFIEELPEVGSAPGELTAALLDGGLDSVGAALAGLAALRSETGIEQPQLALALLDQADVAGQLADEIDGAGALTLGTPSGPVVMDAETLAILDRVIAAPFLGFARQRLSRVDSGTTAGTLPSREEFADLVDRVKRQGITGMQVLGSYVSVLTGVVGLIASAVPGGQPLAGVAGATAVASTAVVTLGSALVSIAADLGIDALRGQDPDLYRAARNAEDVVISGLRSIALTAAGALEWAGQTLINLISFANDSRDGAISLRDASCANEREEQRRFVQRLVPNDFCRLTEDPTHPTPTATSRPAASATPTRARTATPRTSTPRPTSTATRPMATTTRTAAPTGTPTVAHTATATDTRTPTRTRTATHTPNQGTFTVLFYRNTDGATGSGESGAQLRLSGAADFPTIGWTAAVGNAQQVTVGRNGGEILYGINAVGDDNGQPIPIRGPVRYGDYTVPDTVRLFDFAAPPLQPGAEYVAVVTPVLFQGGTAAIVFRVN